MITNHVRAIIAQQIFNSQINEPLQIYLRLIDSNNLITIDQTDTIDSHQWQFFDEQTVLWRPTLWIVSTTVSYIRGDQLPVIAVQRDGIVGGIAAIVNGELFSVQQIQTSQTVIAGNQIQLGYTIDW